MRALIFAAAAGLAIAPALAQDGATGTAPTGEARAVFLDRDGNSIGTATLVDTPNGVLIRADLANLPAGPHGFHIHETGACDTAGGFESAGGHHNPTGAEHGHMVEGGPHAGDMANQTVGEDGTLMVQVINEKVRFDDGDAPLFDDDGSALMIHATADDYRSQPSGAAGDRIACGVIERN